MSNMLETYMSEYCIVDLSERDLIPDYLADGAKIYLFPPTSHTGS